MKNIINRLKTMNPSTAAESIGLAIDLAILENTSRRNKHIDKNRIITMLNSFTMCKKIIITYDDVPYEFLFRDNKETLKSLYIILGWVTGEGYEEDALWVEQFCKNGFLCHDKNGYEYTMKFYN